MLAGLASLDDDEKTLLLGALRQTVLGEAGRLCRLIELFPAATVVCLSRVAMEYYATHTAQLEKSHKEWKGTAMDNGVQTFVSTRYVPKVAERINVLNGRGKARLIDSQLT